MAVGSREVVPLAKGGYPRAQTALGRAFFQYNLMAYAAPDENRRATGVTLLYGALLFDCFRFGEVYTTCESRGVACWLPPGGDMPGLWRQIRAGMLALPLKFGWKGFWRLVEYDNVARQLHERYVNGPHWYLVAIGVEPELQGQGVGSALLRPMLERADREQMACYLDTHQEQNVRLYERHGFEVVERAELPGHPIPVYGMLRRPRGAGA